MTIILAGLYDNGDGAVIVGDKLRTGTHPLDKEEILVEREDITKIFKLNKNVTVATSGDMEFWAEILKDIFEHVKISDDYPKVRILIESIYRKHYARYQWSKMPGFFGFSNMNDYLVRGAKVLSPAQFNNFNNMLLKFVAPGEMTLVGKGKKKYEIYALSDPGILKYCSSSFSLSGSGMPYASKLVVGNYSPTMHQEELVNLLNAGKKLGEQEKHVGSMTDVVILK